jgi:hypothetical protein
MEPRSGASPARLKGDIFKPAGVFLDEYFEVEVHTRLPGGVKEPTIFMDDK